MADFIVREAKPEDAEGIALVHTGTWQSAYRGLVPDDFLDALSVENRTKVWREFLDPTARTHASDEVERVWVAESGGRVVGFVNVGASRDDDASREVGELRAIYVLSESWGTGAGAALMSAGMDWLKRHYREATLWTIDGNDRARTFYEKFGWHFDGTAKDDDSRGFVLKEARYRIEF